MKVQIKFVIPQVPESYNKIKDWHWGKKKAYNEMWYAEIGIAKLLCPSGKVSQQEMEKQAIDSIVKKELGKYRLVYKKNTRTIVAEPRAGTSNLPWEKAEISFYIYFPTKHKRDKINFAAGLKPALDGLIQVGIITDDNWDNIEDQYYKRYDKEKPRTVIMINEGKE